MQRLIPILAGAAFTVATCESAGLLLLRRLKLNLDRAEHYLFAFLTGAAVVSVLMFTLCAIHQARLEVVLPCGILLCGAGLRPAGAKVLPKSLGKRYFLYLLPFTAIFLACFFNAVAPEVSPDGSGYHLGNVVRIWQNHGFVWNYQSIYSCFPQGMEMLFLIAYSIGGFPAAATVHFTFLCVLAALLVCFGRRFGFPHAGICAALLVFATPVVGLVGVSAYNDVALATAIFAVFYLLQVWNQEKNDNTLYLLGLMVGFCFALKYTGWIVLPFAAIASRGRGLFRILPVAAVVALPWVVRNWLWTGNPLAPFLNSWFPNGFYSSALEVDYLHALRHVEGVRHWWEFPVDMTIYGAKTPGFLGPVFLLAPVSLLALRFPQGRKLLVAAAFFALPVVLNPAARFLIPGLPFLALAMGLALQNSPGVLLAIALFHALLALPSVMPVYCADWAWRIRSVPVAVALGRAPEEPFIARYLSDYWLQATIENNIPKDQQIFSFATRHEAYLGRPIVVSYESTFGNRAAQAVWAERISDLKPMGIRFLLLNDSDPGADGIQSKANVLGLSRIEKRNGTSLYRVD